MKTKQISILAILFMLLAVSIVLNIHALYSGHANSLGEHRYTGSSSDYQTLEEAGRDSKGFTKARAGNSAPEQIRLRPNGNDVKNRNDATASPKKPKANGKTTVASKNASNGKPMPYASNAVPSMAVSKSALLESMRESYQPFLKKHPLTDEQLQLVNDADNKESAFIHKMVREGKLGPGVDGDTIVAITEEARRQYGDALREPLGDETFDALRYYQSTLGERGLANEIAGQINLSGFQLSDESIDSLIDIFHNNILLYAKDSLRSQSSSSNDLALKSLTETRNNVMKASSKILTPEQLDVMRQYWDSLISRMEETKARQGQH